MTEREKIHSGDIYWPSDDSIMMEQLGYLELMDEYNNMPRRLMKERGAFLKKMFAEVGEGCYIEAPVFANWGGHHVHLGKFVYANAGLKLVDDTHIYIGDYTMLGPNVVLATAAHPLHPDLRRKGLQYNKPVRIGKNCWLGAGVIVMPGVTIGDNCVIGAGSIVTKDLPSNVIAVGNPCRILREVTEEDRHFYDHGRPIDPAWLD